TMCIYKFTNTFAALILLKGTVFGLSLHTAVIVGISNAVIMRLRINVCLRFLVCRAIIQIVLTAAGQRPGQDGKIRDTSRKFLFGCFLLDGCVHASSPRMSAPGISALKARLARCLTDSVSMRARPSSTNA